MQKSTINSNVEVLDLDFNDETPKELHNSSFFNDWPVVYVINNDKEMYIGETYHSEKRMDQHLKNPVRRELKHVQVFGSDQFTKSATLDIESSLIELCAADENPKRILQNLSGGLSRHSYANKNLFKQDSEIFTSIWKKLYKDGLVNESIETLKNTDLFTYSPYKSLNDEQCTARDKIFEDIAEAFENNEKKSIVVNGSSGTGKSILAIYLMKLLVTNAEYLNDEGDSETYPFINDLRKIRKSKNDLSIAYVVAMTSFRSTLKKVFKKVNGLKSSMVIGPNEVANKHYDILIVDEAHRLKQPRALGADIGRFYETSKKLEMNEKTTNQLDWIKKQSDIQIFFYDSSQKVKPCDIDKECFNNLIRESDYIHLSSQMRCKGGIEYIKFVKDLINQENMNEGLIEFENYELKLFDNLGDMCSEIRNKENEFGLSRIVSGYGFEWKSQSDQNSFDISIDGQNLQWNVKQNAWVLSIDGDRVAKEVGCIHTIQGYDLNYCGVIFGPEIYMKNNIIYVDKDKYCDSAGKKTVENNEELLEYIKNIYSVLMTRGIRGTYIYVCDKELRSYFSRYISKYSRNN